MWPKYIEYYLHSTKEDNWSKGEDLGLSDQALMENFYYTASEVTFRLQVNEDGTNKVLKINDIDVSDKDIVI